MSGRRAAPGPGPRFEGVSVPDPGFAADDGSPDADLVAALARHPQAVGSDGASDASRRVLQALATSRLLVPVVAVLEDEGCSEDGHRVDKQSVMATVVVAGRDGRRALLAFTCTDALVAWRSDGRPVPVAAPRAALAALAEGADALLVDVAGPVPFVVEGADLRTLAFVDRPDPEHDPLVLDAVAALAAGEGGVASASVDRADGVLRVTVVLAGGVDAAERGRLLQRLRERLASDDMLRARVGGGLVLRVQ